MADNRILEFIKVSDVDMGLRYREHYGEIEELAKDIKENGVITPITVVDKSKLLPDELSQLGAQDGTKKYLLMAGGRRVRASLEAELEDIPAQIYVYALTELDLRIVELHENLMRKNLAFAEEVKLRAEVHRLRQEKVGIKVSTAADASGVSARDTAGFLQISPATMSMDLKLAAALQDFPELANEPSKAAAHKRLDEMQRQAARELLAERAKAKMALNDTDKVRRNLAESYRIGNFFDEVSKVEDGIVQLVEMDPPYAIDLHGSKKSGDTENYNEIGSQFYEEWMRKALQECYRVMSEHSWLICWFGPDPWFEPLATWIEEAGFNVRRLPGVWTKRTGQTLQPNRYLASAVEFFFYARKGDPGLNRQGRINVFEYSPVAHNSKTHPTERPIEMIQDVITTFGRPGTTVMVPFAGSGNTILAAHNAGMPAFGWDLSTTYRDNYILKVSTSDVKKFKSY